MELWHTYRDKTVDTSPGSQLKRPPRMGGGLWGIRKINGIKLWPWWDVAPNNIGWSPTATHDYPIGTTNRGFSPPAGGSFSNQLTHPTKYPWNTVGSVLGDADPNAHYRQTAQANMNTGWVSQYPWSPLEPSLLAGTDNVIRYDGFEWTSKSKITLGSSASGIQDFFYRVRGVTAAPKFSRGDSISPSWTYLAATAAPSRSTPENNVVGTASYRNSGWQSSSTILDNDFQWGQSGNSTPAVPNGKQDHYYRSLNSWTTEYSPFFPGFGTANPAVSAQSGGISSTGIGPRIIYFSGNPAPAGRIHNYSPTTKSSFQMGINWSSWLPSSPGKVWWSAGQVARWGTIFMYDLKHLNYISPFSTSTSNPAPGVVGHNKKITDNMFGGTFITLNNGSWCPVTAPSAMGPSPFYSFLSFGGSTAAGATGSPQNFWACTNGPSTMPQPGPVNVPGSAGLVSAASKIFRGHRYGEDTWINYTQWPSTTLMYDAQMIASGGGKNTRRGVQLDQSNGSPTYTDFNFWHYVESTDAWSTYPAGVPSGSGINYSFHKNKNVTHS
jgi:hypothetical protein